MNATLERFAELYATALSEFLRGKGEGPLSRAYALGREALAEGLGVLDMAAVHDAALRRLHEVNPSVAMAAADRAAEHAFLSESLSPFEMVHRGTAETHAVLRRINESLESDVRRLAHALHDEIGPLLFQVHMSLHALAEDLPAAARGRVQEARARLDEVEEQLRRLSHELRPMILEDLGLAAALKYLAEGVAIRAGIPVSVDCSVPAGLSSSAQTALYRIIQQALMNISKHSRAAHASVEVVVDGGCVRCTILDDGVGFEDLARDRDPIDSGGLGLVGMRERAHALGGTIEVSSVPGGGARIEVLIPSGE